MRQHSLAARRVSDDGCGGTALQHRAEGRRPRLGPEPFVQGGAHARVGRGVGQAFLVAAFTAQELEQVRVPAGLQFRQRTGKDGPALAQHQHMVGDAAQAGQVMADHHDGHFRVLAVHGLQQGIHARGRDGVQAGGRLVTQQDARLGDEGPGKARPFAHAARKLVGEIVGKVFQPHHAQDAQPGFAQDVLGQAQMLAEGQADVLHQGQGAQQGAVLEKHAHAAADAPGLGMGQAEQVLAADAQVAADGPRKADDVAQQGGLAAAGAPQDDGDLAAGQGGVDVMQHGVVAVAYGKGRKRDVPGVHGHLQQEGGQHIVGHQDEHAGDDHGRGGGVAHGFGAHTVTPHVGGVALMAADRGHQQAEDQGFDEAPGHVVHGHGAGDAVQIGAFVDVQHEHAGEVTADDADDVEDGREQGEGQQRGHQPGADQIGHGVDVHDVQGVDLVGDAHDADLGRHGGTGASGQHDGREHGAQFADEAQRDGRAQHAHGTELDEGIVALQAQHHAAEDADEQDDEQGFVTDDVQLLDGAGNDAGTGEDMAQAVEHEKGHGAQTAQHAQHSGAQPVAERQDAAHKG